MSITDRGQWPQVDKGFKLLPPTELKRAPGRERKKRFLSVSERSGKATRQVKCPGCGEYGHRAGSWRCSLTRTKKRKRTRKSAPKPGRKKAKADPTPTGANTPRTRAAVTREAAARAVREAQEAAAKAAAAAELAVVAEAAANLELAAAVEAPTTRRNLCMDLQLVTEPDETATMPPKKMTPRKKQLTTKVRKNPAKKGKK